MYVVVRAKLRQTRMTTCQFEIDRYGERSDDDSSNLELVRGGPTGPDMTFKASGGDTGNHASPQRALQDPSTSSSLFFCPTLRIPNILINKREVTRSQVGRCSSIAMASSHRAPSHHGPLSVLCQIRRTLPRTSLYVLLRSNIGSRPWNITRF